MNLFVNEKIFTNKYKSDIIKILNLFQFFNIIRKIKLGHILNLIHIFYS